MRAARCPLKSAVSCSAGRQACTTAAGSPEGLRYGTSGSPEGLRYGTSGAKSAGFLASCSGVRPALTWSASVVTSPRFMPL